MISLGVSTACLYPEVTERAVDELAAAGVKTIEIFYNSPSEYRPEFLKELKKKLDSNGMRAVSMHPYNSFAEPYMLFTGYERRFTDTLEEYKTYFERMSLVGSTIFVFHGDRWDSKFPEERYFERFAALSEAGRQCGILVAQENVQRCRSRDIGFLQRMRRYLNDEVSFVLDIKQAVRSGYSPFEVLETMSGRIVHLHLNDNDNERDCLLPGKGSFDFSAFFQEAERQKYQGAAVIEVYRQNYDTLAEVTEALCYLKKIL